jgi:hypothetical protein
LYLDPDLLEFCELAAPGLQGEPAPRPVHPAVFSRTAELCKVYFFNACLSKLQYSDEAAISELLSTGLVNCLELMEYSTCNKLLSL